jgi:hypothetical protein
MSDWCKKHENPECPDCSEERDRLREELTYFKEKAATRTETGIDLELQYNKLRSLADRMAEALEHCKNRPHEHNPPKEFTMTHCKVIDCSLAAYRQWKEGNR